MTYFIIGDIHACFYTLQNILKYKSLDDYLICVGDYIDRGLFPGETIHLLEEIIDSGRCTLIMGNHDFYYSKFISGITSSQEKYLKNDFEVTRYLLNKNGISNNDMNHFTNNLQFIYETNSFLISHAGISYEVKKRIDENPAIKNSAYGNIKENITTMLGCRKYEFLYENLILNRELPDNIDKLQIHGHTPIMCNNPVYYPKINCWNIDTGAFLGWGMSAIRINEEGKILDTYFINTDLRDINCL
jgi:serine/threonine protein phosphatase 1